MPQESVVTTLSRLSAESFGVFRAERATEDGVTRNQLARLVEQGVIERILPEDVPHGCSRTLSTAAPPWGARLGGRRGRGCGAISR